MKFKLLIKSWFFIGFFSFFILSACNDRLEIKPARKPSPNSTDNKPDDKNDKLGKELTCDEKWIELNLLNPKGMETTYQESQEMKHKESTLVIAQSITEVIIIENDGSSIKWKKNIKTLAPEVGESSSSVVVEKTNFLNLCSKGIKLSYNITPPTDRKPIEKKDVVVKFLDKEYPAQYEKYDFSKSKDPINKDVIEYLIGSQDPYKGVIFISKRVYFKMTSGSVAEITATRKLLNFTPPSPTTPKEPAVFDP